MDWPQLGERECAYNKMIITLHDEEDRLMNVNMEVTAALVGHLILRPPWGAKVSHALAAANSLQPQPGRRLLDGPAELHHSSMWGVCIWVYLVCWQLIPDSCDMCLYMECNVQQVHVAAFCYVVIMLVPCMLVRSRIGCIDYSR